MSEHHAHLVWERGESSFHYKRYDRTHRARFGGGTEMTLSAAPDFLGRAEIPNPEELFAAALSSCHLLTFLAIVSREGLVVERYDDDATATLSYTNEGKLAVTRVTLRPRVKFASDVAEAKLNALHAAAHDECFLALAARCDVVVEPRAFA